MNLKPGKLMIMTETIKIILVEDEVITSLFLKMKLEQMGFMVVKTLSKGEDAVKAIDETEACLILMDINLAGIIDGIEAMKLIKKKTDLPVIFISGYSDESIIEQIKANNYEFTEDGTLH